jgi:hypothetical protein
VYFNFENVASLSISWYIYPLFSPPCFFLPSNIVSNIECEELVFFVVDKLKNKTLVKLAAFGDKVLQPKYSGVICTTPNGHERNRALRATVAFFFRLRFEQSENDYECQLPISRLNSKYSFNLIILTHFSSIFFTSKFFLPFPSLFHSSF